MTNLKIQSKIDSLKPILQELNDNYVHCLARGEMIEAIEAKKKAEVVYNKIGRLVRQKLAS